MKFLLKKHDEQRAGYGCGMYSVDMGHWHHKTGNWDRHGIEGNDCPCRPFWHAVKAMIDNDPVLKLALDSGLITEKEFEWTPDES